MRVGKPAGSSRSVDAATTAEPAGTVVDPRVPARSAPFAEKMAYYRAQHSTRGIRLTHLLGIPGVAFSLPLVVARPRVGLPAFAVSWALQVAGHRIFEHNRPALMDGPITYQLCGLAFWCEEVADLVAGRGLASEE